MDYKNLLIGSKCSTQTILARREIFDKFNFDESLPRLQDYDFVIRSAQEFSYYFIQECLVDVFLQSDSITTKNNEKRLEIAEILYKKHFELCNKYPEFEVFLLETIGYFRCLKKECVFEIYKRIYSLQKNKKNLIKMFLSKLGLLKYFFKGN